MGNLLHNKSHCLKAEDISETMILKWSSSFICLWWHKSAEGVCCFQSLQCQRGVPPGCGVVLWLKAAGMGRGRILLLLPFCTLSLWLTGMFCSSYSSTPAVPSDGDVQHVQAWLWTCSSGWCSQKAWLVFEALLEHFSDSTALDQDLPTVLMWWRKYLFLCVWQNRFNAGLPCLHDCSVTLMLQEGLPKRWEHGTSAGVQIKELFHSGMNGRGA